MPPTKEHMYNRDNLRISNSGSYSYIGKKQLKSRETSNLVDAIPSHDKTTQNISFVRKHRKTRPTPCLTREELGLPTIDTEAVGNASAVSFSLTSREIELIQQLADKCGVPYEKMVAKAIHEGLELLAANFNLLNKYSK
jgi:hypothetical protein